MLMRNIVFIQKINNLFAVPIFSGVYEVNRQLKLDGIDNPYI